MDLCLFARPDLAPGGDFAAFLEIARLAEAAGLHSLCFGEHVVMAEDTSRYPYGPWGHSPGTPWPDPLVSLAAVAAATERVRLSTAVLLASLRAGLVLAKEVATLDVISSGRVELGLGTGWQSEEYAGVGLTWSGRRRRLDEVVEICRAAWGPQPFSIVVAGQRLDGLRALPTPVQSRVPLLYGVRMTPANARRIARLGDGWTPVGVGPDDVRDGVALLRTAYAEAGRDDSALVVRIPLPPVLDAFGRVDAKRTFEPAEAYAAAGATSFAVGFNHRLGSLDEAAELIDGYAAAGAAL
ncbi:MAG TPA: TIGR03619 family F420-dependent LLM class oxidoreductase [Amycolatopsis sp.]|nr:TIGR03619 family F420-dependent LLM class oxidoreductase [Amycolatopsis sp.]